MKTHPAAESFPMMGRESYRELLEDVRINGLYVPLVVCEGMLLDGRNRAKACAELGIEPATETYDGNPWAFVWSMNGTRRDLEKTDRAIIKEVIERKSKEWERRLSKTQEEANRKRSEATKRQHKASRPRSGETMVAVSDQPPPNEPKKDRNVSRAAKAAEAGVSSGTMAAAESLVSKRPDLAEKVQAGKLKGSAAVKQMRREAAEEKAKAAAATIASCSDAYRLEPFDMWSLLEFLGAHKTYRPDKISDDIDLSVPLYEPDEWRENLKSSAGDFSWLVECADVIITDPPYPEEYIGLYQALAVLADFALRPGGSCVTMAGQSFLPEVIDAMSIGNEISYNWTGAYLTPGGQAVQIFPRKVNCFWKPLLWYVKGEYQGPWVGDVCRSAVNNNDKRFHHWGQSESGMVEVIEKYSQPGDTILDPFLGGGTTAVVALALGRKVIGLDIDQSAIDTAKARIAEAICPSNK